MTNIDIKGKKCEFGNKCSKENKRRSDEAESMPNRWVGLGCDTLSRLVRRTVISTVLTFDVGPECWEEAARQRAVGRILQALKIWQVQRASGREELGR